LGSGEPVSGDDGALDPFPAHYAPIVRFLYREAELLDGGRLSDWLTLLTEDIDYRVPTRIARERGAARSEFNSESFHLFENIATLRARVARFESGYAVAEDPPSRTRRMIGNVRVDGVAANGEHNVRSNLLLVRVKQDDPPQLLSAERHDVLRTVGVRLRLARRLVLLDHTVLPLEHLAIFL
jgi:3-phenylpropionate/cinnamic acid dioxygenase small subunit